LFVDKEIGDVLNVNIVNNVDITPSIKTIYFSKNKDSFKFKIVDGSGEF